ncbi:MAG: aminotransferase class III-fold pyridoxal phosphate-dependent enzyme [Sulfurimonas sp.]|nr:aminotransferase class III-fold pyridoxal phosphate-dependent enzyme [Sulfurimonas sp.]
MDYLITEKKYKILESNKTTEKFIYPITSKYIINDNDKSFEFINANNETILKTITNKKMLEIYNYFHIEFNKLHRKLMSIDLLRHKCVNTKIINGEIKKYKIITLQHSFHGRTITTVKATGQESMHNYFGPFPDGFVYADSISEVESLLDDHTCAVMIELIQGEGGVQPQDKEEVQALAKLLKSKNILLMVDEVQTGGYRTGEFLASNVYEIEPDVVTLAKGIGGGVPVGVVMTSLKDVLSAGDHGSTFGGNFLSATAVCEVMDILGECKKSGELESTVTYFNAQLEKFYSAHRNLFTSKVGIGLMCGLRVKNADTLSSIIENAKENGVMALKAGRNTLRFLPPLTITKEEIDEGFKSLTNAVSSL